MSWPQVATPHVGHRLTLTEPYSLKCVDCSMTLLIHKEPRAAAPSGPPPYRRPDNPALRPMPTGLKERTLAEIAARKAMKQTGEQS